MGALGRNTGLGHVAAAGRRAAICMAAAVLAACGQQAGEAPQAEGGQPRATRDEFRAVKPRPDAYGAKASGETLAFYEGEFEAVGTEPDWKLTLLDDVATFQRLGLDEVVGLPSARDIRERGALVEAEPLVIILRAGACEHASGEIFPYLATVQYEDVAYEGCARRAAPGATPAWTAILPELMPAVDACLARVERAPAAVTIAYLTGDGTVSVRLRDADGGRYECVTTQDGGAISGFEPIADRNVIGGEGDPLFTRAPGAPPEGPCYSSAPALGGDGAPIGTITTRTC